MTAPRRSRGLKPSALKHLWSGANSLLAGVPTVSAHLAHVLALGAGDDSSRLARRLQCCHCDALLTLARVRVRSAPTPRRGYGESVGRSLVRTCAVCGRADSTVVNTRAETAQVRTEAKNAAVLARTTPKKSNSIESTKKNRRRKKRKSSSSDASGPAPLTPSPITPQSKTPSTPNPRPKKRAKRQPKMSTTPTASSKLNRNGATPKKQKTPKTPVPRRTSGLQTASFLFEPLD